MLLCLVLPQYIKTRLYTILAFICNLYSSYLMLCEWSYCSYQLRRHQINVDYIGRLFSLTAPSLQKRTLPHGHKTWGKIENVEKSNSPSRGEAGGGKVPLRPTSPRWNNSFLPTFLPLKSGEKLSTISLHLHVFPKLLFFLFQNYHFQSCYYYC